MNKSFPLRSGVPAYPCHWEAGPTRPARHDAYQVRHELQERGYYSIRFVGARPPHFRVKACRGGERFVLHVNFYGRRRNRTMPPSLVVLATRQRQLPLVAPLVCRCTSQPQGKSSDARSCSSCTMHQSLRQRWCMTGLPRGCARTEASPRTQSCKTALRSHPTVAHKKWEQRKEHDRIMAS